MKSEALRGSLDRLEAVLVRADAAVVPLMRPGLPEGRVRSLLGELGLEPTPEILEWFGWHDGAGENGMPSVLMELAPGGEFYELEYLCTECREVREAASYVVDTGPPTNVTAEAFWRNGWFPLLRLFGKGYVAVDLTGAPSDGCPVHVVWHDSDLDARARVAWPSIQAFVDDVIARFESGEYWVDEQGLVQGEVIDFPA